MRSALVGWARSSPLKSSSWIFSPGRGPTKSIATSTSGSKPASGDHLAGQVEDAHRLAHLEHEDVSRAAAEVTRLDHELHRLGNRHEVAGHLRVGDGDRSAALDLIAKDRHHAPGRGEDVAEPDVHEPGARRGAGRRPRRSTRPSPSTLPSPSAGLTALSVEMSTKRSAPRAAAVSAVTRVAIALLRTASSGFASIRATCL